MGGNFSCKEVGDNLFERHCNQFYPGAATGVDQPTRGLIAGLDCRFVCERPGLEHPCLLVYSLESICRARE